MTASNQPLEGLIACPECDTLHNDHDVPTSGRAKCVRCGTVLYAPRDRAMTQLMMLSGAAFLLICVGVYFPFLELNIRGLRSSASLIDVLYAFSDGALAPLAIIVAACVILLPALRFLLLFYVFAPMAVGYAPAQRATTAFRWSESIRPWAMAEVFMIGVAVALVELTSLARVTFGPAFWAVVGVVIVVVAQEVIICRLSVWKTLDQRMA